MSLLIGISGTWVKRPPRGKAEDEQLYCVTVVRCNIMLGSQTDSFTLQAILISTEYERCVCVMKRLSQLRKSLVFLTVYWPSSPVALIKASPPSLPSCCQVAAQTLEGSLHGQQQWAPSTIIHTPYHTPTQTHTSSKPVQWWTWPFH